MQGQEAEMVVRIALQGMSFVVKVAGDAGMHLLAMTKAISKMPDNSPGQKSLARMLKSGDNLHIFAVNENRLDDFKDAAKRYGVQYCVAKRGKEEDGIYEVLVKGSDAPRINYIIDKLGLGKLEDGTIKSDPDEGSMKAEYTSEAMKIMEDMMSPNKNERDREQEVPGEMPTEQTPSAGFYKSTDDRLSIKNTLQETRVEADSINDIFETAKNVRQNYTADPDLPGWDGPEPDTGYRSERKTLQTMVDGEMAARGTISNELSMKIFKAGYRVDTKGKVAEAENLSDSRVRRLIADMISESRELGDDLDKIKEAVKNEQLY